MRYLTVGLILMLGIASVAASGRAPVDLIFDTDMHSDVDDCGALAVLHALADEGLVNLIGALHSAPADFGPHCIDAINTWYGRGELPIGGMMWANYETAPEYQLYRNGAAYVAEHGHDYVEAVAKNFPHTRTVEGAAIPNTVTQYRKLLARAEDASITICAVGQLSGIAGLMDSQPDKFSPLSGEELVQRKVKRLVSMAMGVWPSGKDNFNWAADLASAVRVVNNWPVELVVSPSGEDILTGGRLVTEGPAANPVRLAYEIYTLRAPYLRSSWDQCAAFYAVKGPGDLWKERRGWRIEIDPATGEHEWIEDASSKQICLEQAASSEAIAEVIQELMERPPKG
jgi:inosine-uridine nucleoside N-ribohydrolase